MNDKFKTYAIILAGGVGSRVNSDIPKQFISIKNKPIIVWTLEKFNNNTKVDEIIVSSHSHFKNDIDKIVKVYNIDKVSRIINGGSTRQESAYNAITCQDFNKDDIILIHDAARPMVSERIIDESIENTIKYGAVGTYINAIDTISVGKDGYITSIPDRADLFYTQTPQSFKYSIIKNAHDKALAKKTPGNTDDVSLVLDENIPVKRIEGDPANIKITNAIDLKIAEVLIDLKDF